MVSPEYLTLYVIPSITYAKQASETQLQYIHSHSQMCDFC